MKSSVQIFDDLNWINIFGQFASHFDCTNDNGSSIRSCLLHFIECESTSFLNLLFFSHKWITSSNLVQLKFSTSRFTDIDHLNALFWVNDRLSNQQSFHTENHGLKENFTSGRNRNPTCATNSWEIHPSKRIIIFPQAEFGSPKINHKSPSFLK